MMTDVEIDAVVAELTRDEGLRLFVYDDASGKPITTGSIVVGHPTIGVGRALDKHGIDVAESDLLLRDDIEFFDKQLTDALPWYPALDDVRSRVMLEMGFNLGLNGVLGFHDMLAAIEAQDWRKAEAGMLSSHWARQVGVRATRLATMMLTGNTA